MIWVTIVHRGSIDEGQGVHTISEWIRKAFPGRELAWPEAWEDRQVIIIVMFEGKFSQVKGSKGREVSAMNTAYLGNQWGFVEEPVRNVA